MDIPEQRAETERMARSFHVLGDPACVRLLELLAAAERTSEECAAYLSTTDERLRYYLAALQNSGWITAKRHGRFRSYRLSDPRAAELIALARAMAAENFGALAECTQLDQRP
jgi:ArsR family transcriptional regulator, cadmium/lead-responsive transcriptional repressor